MFKRKHIKLFTCYTALVTDKDGFKKVRPVFVLSLSRRRALCFKITSKFANKKYKIRHNYCLLTNWKADGFVKRSSVDMNSTIYVRRNAFGKSIGYLSSYDLHKIIDFAKRRC